MESLQSSLGAEITCSKAAVWTLRSQHTEGITDIVTWLKWFAAVTLAFIYAIVQEGHRENDQKSSKFHSLKPFM